MVIRDTSSYMDVSLPADFFEYLIEVLEGLVAELGACDSLDDLVHARIVAAPVVRTLVPLAREVGLVTCHHHFTTDRAFRKRAVLDKDDLTKQSLFHCLQDLL